MRSNVILIFLLGIFGSNSFASTCGGQLFVNQAQIDAFLATGCDSILGDVFINDNSGGGPTDITHLDGLANLVYVSGNIWMVPGAAGDGNPLLADISGLGNLMYVGGDLRIISCGQITSLNGLQNLQFVGKALRINNCPNLIDISALSNINAEIVEDIDIFGNTNLLSLTGLEHVTNVGGRVFISENPALQDLTGLMSLDSVFGNFTLRGLDLLNNTDGLQNLVFIGQNLTIGDPPVYPNLSLQNVDSLINLTSVWGDVNIQGNPALSICCGLIPLLDGIDDGSTGPGAAPVPDVGGAIIINNNSVGCNSQAQVFTACSLPIPTMGQWALLLFGLLVFTLGLVVVWNVRKVRPSNN